MYSQLWFFVSIAFSFIAWGIIPARYVWPELRIRHGPTRCGLYSCYTPSASSD